jgi:hypothetical protein
MVTERFEGNARDGFKPPDHARLKVACWAATTREPFCSHFRGRNSVGEACRKEGGTRSLSFAVRYQRSDSLRDANDGDRLPSAFFNRTFRVRLRPEFAQGPIQSIYQPVQFGFAHRRRQAAEDSTR